MSSHEQKQRDLLDALIGVVERDGTLVRISLDG